MTTEREPIWEVDLFVEPLREAYQKEGAAGSWESEKKDVLTALDRIGRRLPPRYKIDKTKPVLGVGGSGIVLRLKDTLFPAVDNALKFPRPVPGKVALVAEMLGKEMGFLANLRHPGIVKILFYTTLENVDGYGSLPFYMMETVDGAKSQKFVLKPETTESQLIRLIRQTAQIIKYLHTEAEPNFAHLDIKPDNIVTDKGGRAIMIDLGTCKLLGGDDQLTLIACTGPFAHPNLLQNLDKDPTDENRSRGNLKRSDIDPQWDLWSFGLTILYWMGIDRNGSEIPDSILPRLTTYIRKYLLLVVARLLVDFPFQWLYERIGLSSDFLSEFKISTSTELCELLDRLDKRCSPLDNIKELLPRGTGTIQASPGVHLANTSRLKKTLSHRLVRRLSSITQLGLVSQVYPSAKHMRREHSLGTYSNACRIIRALYEDSVSPLFKQVIDEQDVRDILLAALLHDIGQFPMAHDLEDVDRFFDHGQLTQSMIKGSWETKKKGGKLVHFESLKDIFDEWETTPERIIAILNARSTNRSSSARQKLLRSIISGPIDADKLDYLFRDARNTDVPYPRGVDTQMIFRTITTVVIKRIDTDQLNIPAIGIYSKGKVAAEFLTLARYAMFSQVYWHHAVRVQKAMLFRAVEMLLSKQNDAKLEALKSSFIEMVYNLPELLYKSVDSTQELFETDEAPSLPVITKFGKGTDLAATDAAVLAWFFEQLNRLRLPEAALIDGILTRTWFKRLWVVSREMQPDRWDAIITAWKNVEDRKKKNDIAHTFEKAILDKLTSSKKAASITDFPADTTIGKLESMTAAHQPWLLIDIPGTRPGSDIPLHYVIESQGRRMRKDDRVVGDAEQSTIWLNYAKNLGMAAGKIRIFAHPDFVDFLDANLEWADGIDALQAKVTAISP